MSNAHPCSYGLNSKSFKSEGTLPFRILAHRYGADRVFSEELISFKLWYCTWHENEELNTIDFVSDKDQSIVLWVLAEEKDWLTI